MSNNKLDTSAQALIRINTEKLELKFEDRKLQQGLDRDSPSANRGRKEQVINEEAITTNTSQTTKSVVCDVLVGLENPNEQNILREKELRGNQA